MRGARLGGPAAHVQKSLARPSAALSQPADKSSPQSQLSRLRIQERHELVAGLAGRRDGLAGRRGDLAGPRKVAGEEEAAAEGGGARRGAGPGSAATCRLERGHRCTPET